MERVSPGWSEFRSVLDKWDDYVENDERKQIEAMVEGNDFVLFFTANGEIFGAGEDGRMTFARMKNPDDEDGDWMADASFSAYNLRRAIKGEAAEAMFNEKDLSKIKIIDRDEAIDKLVEGSDKIRPENKVKKPKEDPQVPDNMDQVDEK